jgi:hypothetical protein
MDSRMREHYWNAKFSHPAAKWPPSEAELALQLRSAVLGEVMPEKKRPFPVSTAWGNLLSACRRTLWCKRLDSDGPDAFATLARAFRAEKEREALLRTVVERIPYGNDLLWAQCRFSTEQSDRDGRSIGIDWNAGLPGVLTSARMLRALGLADEAEDLAYEAWQLMLELSLRYRGRRDDVGAMAEFDRTLAKRPFERAGFPEIQAWIDQHAGALVRGEHVERPPQKNGSFERLFQRLGIATDENAPKKSASPKSVPSTTAGEDFVDWSDLND